MTIKERERLQKIVAQLIHGSRQAAIGVGNAQYDRGFAHGEQAAFGEAIAALNTFLKGTATCSLCGSEFHAANECLSLDRATCGLDVAPG